MFKKKIVKKSRAALRQRPTEDDSDDGDSVNANANDDTTTTQAQLAATRKKRKLLTAVQYKKGVAATDLQKSEGSLLGGVDKTKKNAKMSAAASKVSTAAETSRDGALEQKHRQAMEAYVAQHMGQTGTETQQTTQESKTKTSQIPLSEDALYLDLASQAAKLAGKPVTADDQVSEERGAVLVAGTGIAEVILPVEERLQVAQATTQAQADAAAQRRTASQHRRNIQPQPSAVPNRFAVATPFTDQEFRSQYGRDTPATTPKMDPTASTSASSSTTTTAAANESRPGFEAMRQAMIAPSTQQGHARQQQHSQQQASDHKVFAKFVARQREMRK